MSSQPGISEIELSESLRVQWNSGAEDRFNYLWLRDNARDEANFDAKSHQRRTFTAELDPELRPKAARLAGGNVAIMWPDSEGEVSYTAEFLYEYGKHGASRASAVQTWDRSLTTPRVSFSEVAESRTSLLEALRVFGFALVHDCPTEQSSVEKIAGLLGYVRQTIFGGIWSFENDAAMDDSAYSAESLRPHTDGTYSFDPPGIQILLCLERESEGGESILVDGFNVANQVRLEEPETFKDLCEIPITGIYKGDGEILRAHHPVFRLQNEELRQVCFNNYDRDVMQLPEDELMRMYRGIRVVDKKFNDIQNQWRHTLSAGEAIVFDNWRVLHGRTGFSGKRKMTGTYINREDLESRFLTRIGSV